MGILQRDIQKYGRNTVEDSGRIGEAGPSCVRAPLHETLFAEAQRFLSCPAGLPASGSIRIYDEMLRVFEPDAGKHDFQEIIHVLNAKALLSESPEERLALYDEVIAINRRRNPQRKSDSPSLIPASWIVWEQAIANKVAILRERYVAR
jgi:hypothetical protein